MIFSAIVCTKDRPDDLARCIASLERQTMPLDDILIVDASRDASSGQSVVGAMIQHIYCNPGLTFQRNKGISAVRSDSDIVCFFDDDVELDCHYFEEVAGFFSQDRAKKYIGICGNATNEITRSRIDRLIRHAFLITDNNSGMMLRSGDAGHIFAPKQDCDVAVLSGCNMCFRSSLFFTYGLRFDEKLVAYSYMEDQDFSVRASRIGRLRQIANARLVHHVSSAGRINHRKLFFTYIVNSNYLWHKNLRSQHYPRCAWWWRIVGKLLQATAVSLSERTAGPIVGWCTGVLRRNELLDNPGLSSNVTR